MKNLSKLALALAVSLPSFAFANNNMDMQNTTRSAPAVIVGGQSMFPAKDIVDNAVNSADHTTLVAAVKAADLVGTLKTKGPFTVFAPTNAAFAKLPAGTVETLIKPENKATLAKILTYHVVSGTYDFKAISKEIRKGSLIFSILFFNDKFLTNSNIGQSHII